MILQCSSDSIKGSIHLPASKSISNRVLMIRALCHENFDIQNLSEANDTQLLLHLLDVIDQTTSTQRIDCEDAGTPYRLLLSFLTLQEGKEFILTGSERLKERPIAQLVEALNSIGANIIYLDKEGYAPLKITGKKLTGGTVEIDSNISSQFVSSLCLIAPYLDQGLNIRLKNSIVSASYIQMTLEILKEFGIHVELLNDRIVIPHQHYLPKSIRVENDWSSATFFYAMAMLANNVHIELNGLSAISYQGDSMIQSFAQDFGISSQFAEDKLIISRTAIPNIEIEKEYNLNSCPDLAIPFIVACAVKYPKVRISGIRHLELKESKRITALSTELRKISIVLHYENDLLSFEHSETPHVHRIVNFETYNDHRIAMSLSMLCLADYMVELNETDCVRKSFPGFFEEIVKLGINKR